MATEFRSWLKASIRLSEHRTQANFAKAVGVSQPAVSMWISGRMVPSSYHIKTISTLLDTPESEIEDMIDDQVRTHPLDSSVRDKMFSIDWNHKNTERLNSLLHSMAEGKGE